MKRIKWNKEMCAEEALKYNTKTEFNINACGAYHYAYRRGWIKDICGHMKRPKQKSIWTKEKINEISKLCNSKSEFKKKYARAYRLAIKNWWVEEMTLHMVESRKRNKYWTKEKCSECALLCETKREFRLRFSSAENASRRCGWYFEITQHLKFSGTNNKRLIYAFEFEDNQVYVGLTYHTGSTMNRHLTNSKSAVFKYTTKTGIISKMIICTDFMDAQKASKMEGIIKEKYKNEGWNILNVAPTGNLGGNNIKWTKKKIKKEALKYNNRGEFKYHNPSAYNSACKNGWLNEICSHMLLINNKWTLEKCKKEALKYNTIKIWRKNGNKSYDAAYRNDWLDICCKHMKKLKKIWTFIECKEIALLYNTKSEWKRNCINSYYAAYKNNWLDECCKHMLVLWEKKWFKEKCQELALTCNSRIEFKKKSSSAYHSARKNGWLDEICNHMVKSVYCNNGKKKILK